MSDTDDPHEEVHVIWTPALDLESTPVQAVKQEKAPIEVVCEPAGPLENAAGQAPSPSKLGRKIEVHYQEVSKLRAYQKREQKKKDPKLEKQDRRLQEQDIVMQYLAQNQNMLPEELRNIVLKSTQPDPEPDSPTVETEAQESVPVQSAEPVASSDPHLQDLVPAIFPVDSAQDYPRLGDNSVPRASCNPVDPDVVPTKADQDYPRPRDNLDPPFSSFSASQDVDPAVSPVEAGLNHPRPGDNSITATSKPAFLQHSAVSDSELEQSHQPIIAGSGATLEECPTDLNESVSVLAVGTEIYPRLGDNLPPPSPSHVGEGANTGNGEAGADAAPEPLTNVGLELSQYDALVDHPRPGDDSDTTMVEADFRKDQAVVNGEAADNTPCNTDAEHQEQECRSSPKRNDVVGDDEEHVDYSESPTERHRRENLTDVQSVVENVLRPRAVRSPINPNALPPMARMQCISSLRICTDPTVSAFNQVTASLPAPESGDDSESSYRASIDCSVSLSASLVVSLASRHFDMFTATDAASATMDFTKESVDDGVVDSRPSRGPVRTPVCSPSPLKRICTSPSRRRSMSPTLPSCKTPQRQLYPVLERSDPPQPVSTTSPSVVNAAGMTIPALPRCKALNNCVTRTTSSLGGVPHQPIAMGNPLPHPKSVGTRPPPSRRASCTTHLYPAPDAFASPLLSRPSRSLDSLCRREGEGFDTWLARRSETLGTTSCIANSCRNDLIRGLMRQQEADAKLLAKLNDSKSKEKGL